jgi:hypothetical protein
VPGDYRLKVRSGPHVRKARFPTLEGALLAIEQELGMVPREPAHSALFRDYEPGQQVAGRFEISGPGVRGGLDVRGDGAAEAYRGWIRKEPVERLPGESAVDALRRALIA